MTSERQKGSRLKQMAVDKVLGLNDKPERIAFGMALGLFVGATPTMGFQIALYMFIATLIRANNVAGIPAVFISNPFTAVPLYYGNWKVGRFLLTGSWQASRATRESIERLFFDSEKSAVHRVITVDFWKEIGRMAVSMGSELWVGSCTVGVALAVVGYFATLYAVRRFRRTTL